MNKEPALFTVLINSDNVLELGNFIFKGICVMEQYYEADDQIRMNLYKTIDFLTGAYFKFLFIRIFPSPVMGQERSFKEKINKKIIHLFNEQLFNSSFGYNFEGIYNCFDIIDVSFLLLLPFFLNLPKLSMNLKRKYFYFFFKRSC
jgi:hypothetical protein